MIPADAQAAQAPALPQSTVSGLDRAELIRLAQDRLATAGQGLRAERDGKLVSVSEYQVADARGRPLSVTAVYREGPDVAVVEGSVSARPRAVPGSSGGRAAGEVTLAIRIHFIRRPDGWAVSGDQPFTPKAPAPAAPSPAVLDPARPRPEHVPPPDRDLPAAPKRLFTAAAFEAEAERPPKATGRAGEEPSPVEVGALAFSPDAAVLVAGAPGTLRAWDAWTGGLRWAVVRPGAPGPLHGVAFHPDGSRIATAAPDGVWEWDASRGASRGQVYDSGAAAVARDAAGATTDLPGGVWVVAPVLGGRLVAIGDGPGRPRSDLRAHWPLGGPDWQDGPRYRALAVGSDGRMAVCAATGSYPDEHRLTATVHNGLLRLDIVTGAGAALWEEEPSSQVISKPAVSLAGNRAACAVDPTFPHVGEKRPPEVRVFDLPSGKPGAVIKPPGGVGALAFSPGGRWLFGAGPDGRVRAWEAASGREMFALPGHDGPATAVGVSPDGRLLASGGRDGRVTVWRLAE